MSSPLTLALNCDCLLLESALPSQRQIEVVVQAPASAQAAARPPLNLALVIDRSGSMGGDKLPFAVEAACHALDQLNAGDRAAVVAYDDEVRVLSPSVAMSDRSRAEIKAQIRALRPGGQTDLSGGWLRGAQEVADHQQARQVSRVLLLTDGLANVGITDPEELARHARELAARNVLTSTFGVGTDYDQFLLEAMAQQGGGHYYFIGHPRDIPGVFRGELGGLLSVVAREATLTVTIPPGVSVTLLGDLPHEHSGDTLRLFLRDLAAGERKAFYLQILTPPGTDGTALTLRAELSYADPDGRHQSVRDEAAFRYDTAGASSAPRDKGVQERAGDVAMSAAASRALKLEREGRGQEAAILMRSSLAAAAPCLPAPMAAAYAQQADELGEGLSETDRKTRHAAAYRKRNTR